MKRWGSRFLFSNSARMTDINEEAVIGIKVVAMEVKVMEDIIVVEINGDIRNSEMISATVDMVAENRAKDIAN
jgi:hypothetical protein